MIISGAIRVIDLVSKCGLCYWYGGFFIGTSAITTVTTIGFTIGVGSTAGAEWLKRRIRIGRLRSFGRSADNFA